MPTPIIIDCDPGVDDMVALLTACASPELDLRAVTTVGGNVGIDRTTANARRVLALAGRPDVTVAAGAGRPLVRAIHERAETVHGEDGLGGLDLPAPAGELDPRHAVDLIVATVEQAAERVTLIAVGPLTNVALLAARHPDVYDRLAGVVAMGGSVGAGNMTPAAEFNIWSDPEAAYRVLVDPPVPTVLVPLDLTLVTALTPADLSALAVGRTGAQVAAALGGYRHGSELGIPVHDAVAVAYVARPDLFTVRDAHLDVDTGLGPSRGATLVDWRSPVPTAQVAVAADTRAVVDLIVSRCR